MWPNPRGPDGSRRAVGAGKRADSDAEINVVIAATSARGPFDRCCMAIQFHRNETEN
jgi:hypothetical protein